MNGEPAYMPLYYGDILKATEYWSGAERALYVLLRASQWERGALPSDPVRIARGLHYEVDDFLALWSTVGTKFTQTNDGLVDLELDDFRTRVIESSRRRTASASIGGQANRERWEQLKAERIANAMPTDKQTDSEPDSERIAKGKPNASHSNPIQSNPIQSKNQNSESLGQSATARHGFEPESKTHTPVAKRETRPSTVQDLDDAVALQALDDELDLQANERDPLDVEFEQVQRAYPKRAGAHRWTDARKALNARKREGHTFADILAGVERYAVHIRAAGKEGTEYVQQAATFLGTNRGFLEAWSNAPTKAEARQTRTLDAAQSWLAETEHEGRQ